MPLDRRHSERGLSIAAMSIIAAGIILRFVHLDADPRYYEWIGYITDEGRWIQAARNLGLGMPLPEGLGGLHLTMAPLFQAIIFLTFSLVEPSAWAARLVSAVSGSFILVAFWMMMRRIASKEAVLAGLAVMALQTDMVELSRLSIPEVPAMLLELLVYWTLLGSQSAFRFAVAGVLTVFTIAMKLTAAPIVLIACAIVLAGPWAQANLRTRFSNLVFYLLPLAACAAVGAVAWLLASGGVVSDGLKYQVDSASTLVDTSVGFAILNFFFSGGFATTFNLLSLGVWITILALSHGRLNGSDERPHAVASLIWIGFYVVVMLGLAYFPTRYRIHVVIPMAVNLCCGISLLRKIGPTALAEGIQRTTGVRGAIRMTLLAIPTAVILSPVVMLLLALPGFDSARLTIRIAAIAISTAVVAAVALSTRSISGSGTAFLLFPFLFAALYFTFGTITTFWDTATFLVSPPAAAIVGATAASFTILLRPWKWRLQAVRYVVVLFVIAGSIFKTTETLARYSSPQHSLTSISNDLATTLAECADIQAYRTEGLFNDNDLAYKNFDFQSFMGMYGRARPDCLVTAFEAANVSSAPEHYTVLKTYAATISPEYCSRGFEPHETCAVTITAYKLAANVTDAPNAQ